eukprot:531513_1
MLLIQGYKGALNMCVSLKNINDTELKLLKEIKGYIEDGNEKDFLHPTSGTTFYLHPYILDIIENCCSKLLSINPNKCEYHYLYATTLPLSLHTLDMESLRDKHYSIGYELDNYNPWNIWKQNTSYSQHNPSYGFHGIYGVKQWLKPDYLDWFEHMELNLSDSDYRKKYNLIIHETECKYLTLYACFILPYIQQNDRLTVIQTTAEYFTRYRYIINYLNTKKTYLFTKNHLHYCLNFAHQFRLFGQFHKAVTVFNSFVECFDANCNYITEQAVYNVREWAHINVMVDTMLCAGDMEQCCQFIKKLIFKLSAIPYFCLLLYTILCRIYAQNKLFGFSNVKHFVSLTLQAKKNFRCKKERRPGTTNWSNSPIHYYTDICLLYLGICRNKNVNFKTVNDIDCKSQIEYTINKEIDSHHPSYGWSGQTSFFAESCFMLAFIYQKFIKNNKCALFLYYLSILHSSELPISYSTIASYFNLSICLYKSKQYQLSLNVFKRLYKFSNQAEMANKTKRKIKKVKKKMRQDAKCNMCQNKQLNLKLKSCKGCLLVFYCSAKCQKKDWKKSHRYNCNRLWLDKAYFVNCKSLIQFNQSKAHAGCSILTQKQHGGPKKQRPDTFMYYLKQHT